MAQVKLSFVNTNGARMVCTRSLQLTVKKTTRTQKTLDGQLLMYKDNQRSTVSTKCVELDTMLPNFLGVSRSILDNVIFCHQEESMWPLSEASVLKKKFDEIFEAQKYTKAIDNIKALRKKQAEEIKRLQLMQDQFKVDKERAERSEKKTKDIWSRIETLREEREELSREITKVHDEIISIRQISASFERDVVLLESQRAEAQRLNATIEKLQNSTELLTDSDEALEDRLMNFEDEMEKFAGRIKRKEKEKTELKTQQGESRTKLGRHANQKGLLEGRKEHYELQIAHRKLMVKDASAEHEIRGFSSGDLDERQVADFMSKIDRLNREQLGNLERAKREGSEEQLQASKALNALNQKLASLDQAKRYANTEIDNLSSQLHALQKGLDKLPVNEGRITRLEIMVTDGNTRFSEMNENYNREQWDNRIQAKDSEIWEIEANITRETKELTKGTAEADSKAELAYLQKEVETKKLAQESLILANTDKFDRLLGKWGVTTLNDDFHEALEQRDEDISKATKLLESSNSELTQTESQLKTQKDLLKKKIQEFERSSGAVARAMEKSTFSECTEYLTVVKNTEEDLETAQRDLAMVEQTKSSYDKAVKMARERHCCRMCRREYPDEDDLNEFIARLQREIEKQEVSIVEAEIRRIVNDLKALKDVSLDFEIATKLQEQELPQIRNEHARLEKKQETLLASYEARKRDLDERVTKKREVEGLRNPVSEIPKYEKDVRENQEQINSLVRRLEAMGSSRSVQDIQRALQSLNEQARKVKQERDALSSDKETARTELTVFERQVQEHQTQLVAAKHELEKKQSHAKRLTETSDAILQRQQHISEAEEEAKSVHPQIIKAQAREAEIREKWVEKEKSLQAIARKLSDTVHKFETIQREISQYESGDTVEALANLLRESSQLEQKIEQMDEHLMVLEADLVELRSQKDKAGNFKRSIEDNIWLRKSEKELLVAQEIIVRLEGKNAEARTIQFKLDEEKLQRKHDGLVMDRTGKGATIKSLDSQLTEILKEYEVDFKDAKKNFHEGQIRLQTTTVANDDLAKYQTALDKYGFSDKPVSGVFELTNKSLKGGYEIPFSKDGGS
ncbi:hypothetical protein ABW20_dc0108172 [Dactylellina cionopaga]|nr:hypothetical protein ABW20_dc0108172 [Dactylellina cionopaga]